MRKFDMFIIAVCVLFLVKLRWPKNKSLYDAVTLFTGSPSAICVGSDFRGHLVEFGRNILELLVYYLMLNKCKNLKDMKSSCLSVCTSSLYDNEGRYFSHYYMRFGPLMFKSYHMYSNLKR